MRQEKDWIRVAVPDLRIVSANLARRVDDQIAERRRPNLSGNSQGARRKKHLLSGLIKCGACGANFVINGKDYYRCARNREGGCSTTLSIRKSALEEAVFSIIRSRLMTTEMSDLFAAEFNREVERLRDSGSGDAARLRSRISEIETEMRNLAQNFTKGVVSDMLVSMMNEREQERARLVERLGLVENLHSAEVIPHPRLFESYAKKVDNLSTALSNAAVREEAAASLRTLIDQITIFSDESETYAEVLSDPAKVMDFAYDKPATSMRQRASSIAVVAGVGFEPTTFRL
ncbi:MAG: hypothetical protein DI591_13590 [Citromicrobium sp.]|nr:MAG: hypothetical protein DI591_13590 [Citromicrobium sp.]